MFQLDDKFLQDVGLAQLPADQKQAFLEQAATEQWWLLMEHDRYHECIQVGNIDGRWKVIATSTLNDIVL